MVNVLCHPDKQCWAFIDQLSFNESDIVIMSKNGDLVEHKTVDKNLVELLKQMTVYERWNRLK